MSASLRCYLAVAVLSAALGCHYQGGGTALLRKPEASAPGGMKTAGQIVFRWQSRGDAASGDMQASLPDGRRFEGSYVQPVTTEWRETYAPFYGAFAGPWGYARPWYGGPRSSFATQYGGSALAHLESADGTRMRCQFALFSPNTGLRGGGQGECQLSTNEDAFGAVLRSDP